MSDAVDLYMSSPQPASVPVSAPDTGADIAPMDADYPSENISAV